MLTDYTGVRFAPVLPIDLAKELKDRRLLGQYHLLLAHDVVKRPNEYQEVYNGPDDVDNFIIMDNSVVELDTPVDIEMILEAAQIVNAELLTLPDIYLKRHATVKATFDGYEKLHGRWTNDFMVLPQGETYTDWLMCADELLAYAPHQFACVGIPRNVRESLDVSRIQALDHLRDLDRKHHKGRADKRFYHLFGFSHDLMDDVAAARYGIHKNVMGIDSNVPIRMGTHQQRLSINQIDPGKRGKTWWDDHPPYNDMIKVNLESIRKLIGDRSGG